MQSNAKFAEINGYKDPDPTEKDRYGKSGILYNYGQSKRIGEAMLADGELSK